MNIETNRDAMTSAEKKVVLDLTPDKTTEFTRENLETYDLIRVRAAHPRVFGSQSPKWLISTGAYLVDVSDIDLDNVIFEQVARVNVSPVWQVLKEDIIKNGFNLAELGIMVMRLENGKYIVMEGRSRLKILQEMGMTNIVAEVFRETTIANMVRFALFMNSTKKPYGEASVQDITKGINYLIENGVIKKEPNTVQGRSALAIAVSTELTYMSGGKLTNNAFDTIVHNAISKLTGVKNVISFPKGEGSQAYLNNLIGAEQLKEDLENGIIYVARANFTEKIYSGMIKALEKSAPDVKQIRFIIQIGVPKAVDPENDWIKNGAGFKKQFDIFEKKISKIRFHNVEVNDSRVCIYGCIPQVRSLDHKYPMNRLYIYR